MGGLGSGRYGCRSSKDVVETCRILSAAQMMRAKVLQPDVHAKGIWAWWIASTGERSSWLDFEVNTLDATSAWLRLTYRFKGTDETLNLDVPLTTTDLPWGGSRWWFICRLIADGKYCGRRVDKLYLPPGGRFYGCRHCYSLTYLSCQESRKSDRMFVRLGWEWGVSAKEAKRLLEEGFMP